MTDLSIDLVEYLHKLALEEDADLLRESLKLMVQLLMEADVSAQIQARKYERTAERVTQRNGYRERRWKSRVPDILKGLREPDADLKCIPEPRIVIRVDNRDKGR
jgi:transposase-like protein